MPSTAPRDRVVRIGAARRWYSLGLSEIWSYRDLLLSLGQRDVRLRYRQTVIGPVWVVIQPLLAAGIFSFVFGSVARLPSNGQPYFLFAFAGLLCWNVFNSGLNRSTASLLSNVHLVAKVYFPRLILPASTLLGTLIDFAVATSMMAILLVAYDVPITFRLALLPVWLLLTLAMALGLGLLLGGASVRYRDVAIITPIATQFLLYVSPVAYSLDRVPASLRTPFSLNPLTGVLEGFRWSLLGGTELSSLALTASIVGSLVFLALGVFTFRRMEGQFADVI